jgi:metacaspase-1
MAKGIALTVGLNSVDPHHYAGWSGELLACEADAKDMATIAQHAGFTVTTLLTKAATKQAVLDKIASAAAKLAEGDIFLFTNSSHGGQLPDKNGDEPDGQDETLCFYDGELVDDELYAALAAFQPGVRILAFSDSCHSGSVLKVYLANARARARGANPANAESLPERPRGLPPDIALRTYEAHRVHYDRILTDPKLRNSRDQVQASAILISGCQDNQESQDGTFNGLFTGTLRAVWNGGQFKGNYRAFHKAILGRMPPSQSPNFFTVGPRSSKFEHQHPFTI